MPEIRFQIQWPDGSQEACYCPSLVVKNYFTPNSDYALDDFVERSPLKLKDCSCELEQLSFQLDVSGKTLKVPNSKLDAARKKLERLSSKLGVCSKSSEPLSSRLGVPSRKLGSSSSRLDSSSLELYAQFSG